MFDFTKKKVAVAVNLALVLSGSLVLNSNALAQEQDQDKKEQQEGTERIEVKGFRGSIQKSLNIKRFSNVIVDAVSAEDIGKFPDQTVADALQRVAGVQVQKSEGESDRVSIRGTAPHLNLTLLNGQNVASATASSSIVTASRGFNYSLLPTELIDTLEVHKSAQAKVVEGSLGGTVIVKTRNPFDSEANTMAFSLKDVYQETTGKHSPTLSGFYSWKDDDSKFGFNIGAVLKETTTQRDGLSAGGFNHIASNDSLTYYTPRNVNASRFNAEKDLNTVSGTLQYAPASNMLLTFHNLYSKADKENTSFANGVWVGENSFADLTGSLQGDIMTSGNLASNPNDLNSDPRWHHYGNYLESRYTTTREAGAYKTRVHDLKLEWDADAFSLTAQAGVTKADGQISIRALDFEAPTEATFDVSNEQIDFTLSQATSPQDYVGVYIADKNYVNDEKETYYQTDIHMPLDAGIFTSVDFGARYSDHDKSSRVQLNEHYPWFSYNEEYSGSAYLESLYPGFGVQAIDLSGWAGAPVSDFMGGGSQPYLYDFDFGKLDNAFTEVGLLRSYWHPSYSLTLNEKVTSAYVQANFEADKWRGNLGVRVAQTKQKSIGFDILKPDGFFPGDKLADAQSPVTTDRDYTDVLPSLNVSYSVNDDVIVRFAAASVMSRPDYDLLAHRKIYSRTGGIQGNPELDPTKADQYDISVEYYFTDASIISLAYFVKNIKSYVTEDMVLANVLLPNDDSTNVLDEEGVGYHIEQMELRTPINGEGGTNKGFEINVQHDFGNGFGAQANYTYQDAELDEEGAVLPNNSEDTFNLSGYYEKDGILARVSYSYRSEYFAGLSRDIDRYTDDYGQWDANFSYNLNENISLSLQILNLTDENQQSFVQSETGQRALLSDYNYGRRIFSGISAKF
ncbi:TonB-dependent receptor [Neptunicella marina]|uniref:TonB-dependent receptor n=1 Tax=Neptunicella marina TaxID=2125989 RepID=A0A8J6IU84_9ALTE|nr:TonB-dependent receptor [Neptunicella marina]MBC3765538.1 TonB-dependent receptor [Neptunicella marina]